MICAPDPCECFAPKKKAVAPRKRPAVEVAPEQPQSGPEPVEASPPRQDLRAKMKAAAATAPKVEIKAPEQKARRQQHTEITKAAPAPRPTLSDEQLLLNAALRALGPILCPEDTERYRMIISSTPSQDERKAEWKARRRCQQQTQG